MFKRTKKPFTTQQYLLHDNDPVRLLQKVNLMRHQYARCVRVAPLQEAPVADAQLEQVFGDVRIHRTERVVQQIHVRLPVDGPS